LKTKHIISYLLILVFIFAKDIILPDPDNSYFKIYYFILLSIFIIHYFYYTLNNKIRIYFKIFFITGLITIYLFEFYLTFEKFNIIKNKNINFNKIRTLYKKNKNLDWDLRKPYEVYLDYSNKNISVSMANVPRYDEINQIHFFSGKSNIWTILGNENGYYAEYQSDRYGFNNPDYVWDNKIIDYIILGDSIVHGQSVNRPDDISSVLRNLSGNKILNLGYRGTSTLSQLGILKEYSQKKKIYNLILFINEHNDFNEIENEYSYEILKKYLYNNEFRQNLINKQSLIDKITEQKINKGLNYEIILNKQKINDSKKINILKRFVKLSNTRQKLLHESKSKSVSSFDNHLKIFENTIIEIKNFTNLNDIRFYIVLLPSIYKFYPNYKNDKSSIVKEIILKNNINFLDLNDELFVKISDPLDLWPFAIFDKENILFFHLNENGYYKVAETIYEKIMID
jgi:hypothetical protein